MRLHPYQKKHMRLHYALKLGWEYNKEQRRSMVEGTRTRHASLFPTPDAPITTQKVSSFPWKKVALRASEGRRCSQLSYTMEHSFSHSTTLYARFNLSYSPDKKPLSMLRPCDRYTCSLMPSLKWDCVGRTRRFKDNGNRSCHCDFVFMRW